jgi:large repetitive protein
VDPFPQNAANFFEVWNQNGDTMANQAGAQSTFLMAAGNGNQALELNNATNGTNPQTLGIERSVATVAGQVYTLTFDYAGRLGFGTDFTKVQVTVNGVAIDFADTSTQTALNWQTLSFSFLGDGTSKVVRIETDPIQVNAAGRGALIDDITLNHAQGVIAGNAVTGTKTDIGLDRYIDAALVDADGSESLTLTLTGLPTGAQVVTASGTVNAVNGSITFAAADLPTAALRLDSSFIGNLEIGVRSTATEASNGASASSAIQTLSLAVSPQTGATVDPSVRLMGGLGADSLIGDVGSQTLYGGKGNDTLTGDTAADTFRWSLGDHGANGTPAVDTITDFAAATVATGGDILDLRDILQGENTAGGVGNLQNYLDFDTTSSAGNTIIRISSSGGFAGGTYAAGVEDQRIVLSGLNLRTALGLTTTATDNQVLQDLLNKGKLIVDT